MSVGRYLSNPTHDFAIRIFRTRKSISSIEISLFAIAAFMAIIAPAASSKVSRISFPAKTARTFACPFEKYFMAPSMSIASVKVNPLKLRSLRKISVTILLEKVAAKFLVVSSTGTLK